MENRAGLLGGTFDPVHAGHIELGRNMRTAFSLDRVYYILSARPPHKQGRPVTAAPLRWRMLTVALKPYPELVASDLELRRSRPSWTVDTVDILQRDHPGARFYFISGSEGFLKIRTWRDYQRLLNMVSFIVLLRRSSDRPKVVRLLNEEGLSPCSADSVACPDCHVFLHGYGSEHLELSSTEIRARVLRGEEIGGLVPPEVNRIIKENGLYGC